MTLHFAYGSNMSRALMAARCPGATVLGVASLAGWRFVISPDGYGSIALHPGGIVYGVLSGGGHWIGALEWSRS